METEMMLDNKNTITMKLLHYFITEKNYNPIILQGVENEIWLENLDEDYKIVRIVSGYIHNNEQFDFDKFKTKRIMKKIKKKTLSLNLNVLSIFLNLGDNVTSDLNENPNAICVNIKEEIDLEKSAEIKKAFPDLKNKLKFTEQGIELFMKITGDINKHNREDAKRVEKVFKQKIPVVTYILIAINIVIFIFGFLFTNFDMFLNAFCIHGPSIRAGQLYRIITGVFVHNGISHILFNCYSLYILGSQLESFLGKWKFTIIYLYSALIGALFSMAFGGDTGSVGASGAIFGIMGSLLYFGYHYRVYLGNVVKSQLIPLIAINLLIGFMPGSNIDNAAHIGGLIGGAFMTIALGVKDKTSTFEKVNGFIVAASLLLFMYYTAFILVA